MNLDALTSAMANKEELLKELDSRISVLETELASLRQVKSVLFPVRRLRRGSRAELVENLLSTATVWMTASEINGILKVDGGKVARELYKMSKTGRMEKRKTEGSKYQYRTVTEGAQA